MSTYNTDKNLIGGGKKYQHNICIDMLKFLAVILITNSHYDIVYGPINPIATGGAIGDVLFFFCSGFTLFLGRTGRFDNWYRRRISRIYPSVFGWALLTALFFNKQTSFSSVIIHGGDAFVTAIMVYYVVLYFVKRYMMNKLNWAFAICCIYILLWYIFMFEPKDVNHLFKGRYINFCQYYHYILYMLLGAMVGVRYNYDKQIQKGEKSYYLLKHGLLLLVYLILFYGIQYAETKSVFVTNIQIVTLLPLLGIVWEFWMLMHSKHLLKLYNIRYVGMTVTVVSGLCLDIYITQMTLLGYYNNSVKEGGWATFIQNLFPLNIIIVSCVILLSAYILRSTGRWFVQTFGKEDYNWKEILKLK